MSRGEDRYLQLVTKEHAIIKEEKAALGHFDVLEKFERDHFSALSAAVRESHEKEREYAEKTKYWSVIGSVIGAVLGILGTTLSNHIRLKELRGMVKSANNGRLEELIIDTSETLKSQYNTMQGFVGELKSLLIHPTAKSSLFLLPSGSEVSYSPQLEARIHQVLEVIRQQEGTVTAEMNDIKALIVAERNKDSDVNMIYVGPEVQNILQETEDDLEWRIKMNSLGTVVFIYGAFALTLPVLYNIFRGV